MKKTLLPIALLSIFLLAGCNQVKNIDIPVADETGFFVCTDAEKNATACNLNKKPVCWDNHKTYDNYCFACASNEITWYVDGECVNTCENDNTCPSGEQTIPLELDVVEPEPEIIQPSSQEIWIELNVIDPNE